MKKCIPFTLVLFLTAIACHRVPSGEVITVTGEIPAEEMGLTLPHEHVLVDFIGADSTGPHRYDREVALKVILPQIEKLKNYGVRTFVECTPQYLGRDVLLLRQLSDSTGIHFLTNTGYYGAQKNKFIPDSVLEMTAEKIAGIWIAEFENGIENTGIRPGFIKIAVERSALSEFHARLARAAAITHKATGLTIMSHTGPAVGAFLQLEILKQEGVAPDAFIWTHAHNEKDSMKHVEAAQMGAWVAFDAFRGSDSQLSQFVNIVLNMKQHNCLNRLLLSHDAGWFNPDQPDASKYQPHTFIFEKLVPALKAAGITESELHQIMEVNPARAFAVSKRTI